MKLNIKSAFSFLPLVLLAVHVNGQSVTMGLSAGLLTSALYNPHNQYELGFDPQRGYTTRLELYWNIAEHLSLRTGLGIETKGTHYEHPGNIAANLSSRNIPITGNTIVPFGPIPNTASRIYHDGLDYLEIPLALQMTFGKDLKILPFFGQSFGWLVQHTASYYPSLLEVMAPNKINYLNNFSYSLIAGTGFGIPLKGRLHFVFEGMASYGLTNVVKNEEVKVKNFALMGTGGVRFIL